MCDVMNVFLTVMGFVVFIDSIILLLGWTFYKDAKDAGNEKTRVFIKIFILSVVAIITLVGLCLGMAAPGIYGC